MSLRSRMLLAGLVAVLVVPLGAAPALADPLPDTITVSASGQVDVDPDIGTVVLGVRARAASAQVAADRLSARIRKVVRALKGAGFTNDELSTENIRLYRRCFSDCRDLNPRDNIKPEPVFGYVGSAGVKVRTRALKRLGEIIDVGIAAGA
ncbi:MAG: SIMPL domain-containing protein, partial [Actinobacteria bacterium]|nr:SIMPL domain-containing protein [Actinomycetota bacterium]